MKGNRTVWRMAAGMAAVLLSGCGGRQTQEVLVTPRQEISETPALAGSQSIREQVQVPEMAELSEGLGMVGNSGDMEGKTVSIHMDGDIIVPDAEGFLLFQASPRYFTQEDYDRVSRVLLPDASFLFKEGGRQQEEYTEKLEKKIEEIEEQRKRIESSIAALEEQIKELPSGSGQEEQALRVNQAALRAKSEELALVSEEIAAQRAKLSMVQITPTVFQGALLDAYAQGENWKYYVNLNNEWVPQDNSFSGFRILRGEKADRKYLPLPKDSMPEKISPSEAERKAGELVRDMGFEDMELFGTESVKADDTGKIICCTHFVRTLRGIPVTYTYDTGETVESDGDASWAYERLDLYFDEKGLCDFIWNSPYELEKQSDEYVFLLPFSEIRDIFSKMMTERCWERIRMQQGMEAFVEVREIRLGYMRIKGEEEGAGRMIPVWDFFGAVHMGCPGGDSEKDTAGAYESLMTINAMDGTLIDRKLGY